MKWVKSLKKNEKKLRDYGLLRCTRNDVRSVDCHVASRNDEEAINCCVAPFLAMTRAVDCRVAAAPRNDEFYQALYLRGIAHQAWSSAAGSHRTERSEGGGRALSELRKACDSVDLGSKENCVPAKFQENRICRLLYFAQVVCKILDGVLKKITA